MIWRFSKDNDKNKASEGAEDDSLPLEKRRVYDQNRGAFHGTKFRTCRFDQGGELLGNLYMKALLTGDGKWTVFAVSETGAEGPQGEPSTATEIKKQGLCFLEALDYCARWEAVERYQALHLPVDPDEQGKLGFDHYWMFGEREGLIFDQNGLPHETRNGEIATGGSFANKALDSAAQNYQPPLEGLKVAFAAAAVDLDAFVRALTPNATTVPGALDSVLKLYEDAEQKIIALDRLRKRAEDFSYKMRQVRDAWVDGTYIGWNENDLYNDHEGPYQKVVKWLNEAKESAKALAGVSPEMLEISHRVDFCQLAVRIQKAQDNMFRVAVGQMPPAVAQREISELKSQCQRILQFHGITELDPVDIDTLILQGQSRAPEKRYDISYNDWDRRQVIKSPQAFFVNAESLKFKVMSGFSGIRGRYRPDQNAPPVPEAVAAFFASCDQMPYEIQRKILETQKEAQKKAQALAEANVQKAAVRPQGPAPAP